MLNLLGSSNNMSELVDFAEFALSPLIGENLNR